MLPSINEPARFMDNLGSAVIMFDYFRRVAIAVIELLFILLFGLLSILTMTAGLTFGEFMKSIPISLRVLFCIGICAAIFAVGWLIYVLIKWLC